MSRAKRLVDAAHVEAFVWGGPHAPASHPSHPANPPAHTSVAAAGPTVEQASAVQAQLAEVEKAAFAKGLAQGQKAGQDAADQRVEAMLRKLTETLQELTQLRSRMIHQTERQMVELAIAVARRVVHREVSLDPDLLVAMARVALDRLGEAAQITVRLNPEDFRITGATRVAQLTASNVAVVADGRVPRGGCRVDSEMGTFDAGIDAQIQEIAHALLGRAEQSAGGVAGG